jgi:hypothetical protein
MSITKPGTTTPAHATVGIGRPASPRSSQARSRATARTCFTLSRVTESTLSSTRQQVAGDATRPNRPGWFRCPARSAIASPPSASITATSTSTRPGGCADRRTRATPAAASNPGDQPRCLGHIGQQPGSDMGHDTPPVRRHHNPRERPCNVHLRSAFR